MNLDEIKSNLLTSKKQRSEKYISENYPDLHELLLSNAYDDFEEYKLKITKFIYGGGYCKSCNNRTKRSTSGGGFTDFCNKKCSVDHGMANGTYTAAGKITLDENEIKRLYLDEKKSPKEIGELLGCSNVTINKHIARLGIKRSHKEQQIIHSVKGATPWNSGEFDKSLAYDIEYITNENKTKSIAAIAKDLGCSSSLLLQLLTKNNIKPENHKRTIPEQMIQDILTNLNIPFIECYRDTKELDVYLPDYNIGIECNGIYWHSEKFRHKDYHIDKTNHFNSKGINVLHFWDYEITDTPELIESVIKSKLGITNKIYARKCTIKDVDAKTAKSFCNDNHIQGSANSSIKKGLYYNDELVALATFAKPRFDKNHDCELIRYCSLKGHTVVGGFSKLVNTLPTGTKLLSYANLRFSNGNVYEKNGFELLHKSKVGFFWYNVKSGEINGRLHFQESHLKMQEQNVYRVFDCGNAVYSKII